MMKLPRAWYYACSLRELARGPRSVRLGEREYVAFKSASGRVSVLGGRCIHLGADLSRGAVVGECLRCPLHEWEFDGDGRCLRIPASEEIPGFARQTAYPAVVRGGHVFFCNSPTPPFEAPFFDGMDPADLLPAKPIVMEAALPWYMVGANGFDIQHFRTAHDRTLLATPAVECPSLFARTIRMQFAVSGNGIHDRLTRRFSGPQSTMTVTSWCGTIILATAQFKRMTTRGMVCITPLNANRSRLATIVWVPRSRGGIGQALFDPIDAAVRRSFIRRFLLSDRAGSEGTRYTPGTLIAADAVLAEYLQWLWDVARLEPGACPEGAHDA